MRALIVTGGSTDRDFALEWIANACYDLKIAADSGMHFFYETGLRPDLVAGDFDSAVPEELAYFMAMDSVEVEKLNPIKDDTDTEHAIRSAIRRGADTIDILGATGSRLDHVMGNLTLLGIGLEEGVEIAILDPCNRIRMISGNLEIPKASQFGKYLSLLPFAGEVCGVTLKGMKYPLDHYDMGGFNSLGVSNEIIGEVGRIEMESGYLLVIESRDHWEKA